MRPLVFVVLLGILPPAIGQTPPQGLAGARSNARPALPPPELHAKPGAQDFDLTANGRSLYEQVAHAFQLDCVFNDDFTSDRAFRLRLRDVDYRDALHALEAATGSFVVAISNRVFLVAKETPQNRLALEPTINLSTEISQAITPQELNEVVRAVQQAVGLQKLAIDTQNNIISFNGPASVAFPARQLFETLLHHRPQIEVELEMVEVSRSDMLTWGLTLPDTFSISQIDTSSNVMTALVNIARWWKGGSGLGLAIGQAQAIAQMNQFTGKSLLHMQLRSLDGQAATFHVGDRYPILSSAYIGSGSTSNSSLSPSNSNSSNNGSSSTSQSAGKVFGSVPLPTAVIAADFNGDGIPDIAASSAGSNAVAILIGNGDGTFKDAVTYAAGKNPAAIAAADLDSDGRLDLITANGGSNDASVLIGNGDGTFKDAVTYTAGTNPAAVAVGDFDGDGHLDFAIANADSNNISIFPGIGGGAFAAALTVSAGTSPRSLLAADFNRDGMSDLAVANFTSNDLMILLANGSGAFRQAADYPTGNGPHGIAADNLNLDSNLDLIVANSASNTVSVFLGDGTGGFAGGAQYNTGPGPVSVTSGDFNLDSLKDVAVACPGNNTVSLLLGLGDGTFQAPISINTGAAGQSITSADFNRDSLPDLLTGNTLSGDFSILLGYGNASFHDPGGNGFDSSGGQIVAPPPAFTFEDLGLLVKVTPHVHGLEEVTLDIDASYKLITGQAANGMPVISNRKLTSQVTARNGEWGVIAGLLSTSDAHSITGSIPLFRQRQHDRTNSQVLLLIQTHVVSAPEQGVTEPVRLGTETRPLTRM